MPFHCPMCGKILSPEQSSLRCLDGHNFDRAKEGYWNLLLVQQKATLDPGDNKEMVEARRRFLASGHFARIAEKKNEILRGLVGCKQILDAGCGEGYYLGRVREALPDAELAGIDISKWAVRAAAKAYKNIAWAVASNKQLPFAPQQFDVILNAFGFPFWESFRSALKPGGHVLLVDPAPEHLWELRELIYEKVNAKELVSIEGALAAGFSLEKEERLEFVMSLHSIAAIQDLLAMTPHGYRMNEEAKQRLASLQNLQTKVSVVFRLLKLS